MASPGPSILPSPVVTGFPSFSGTGPASDHRPPAVYLLLCLYPCSEFNHPGVSWQGCAKSLLWERRELQSHNHCPGSPAKLPVTAAVSRAGPRTLPLANKVSLLSVFKCHLQPLASKLHISWNFAGCLFCSSEDRLGVPVGCTSKWVQLPPTSPPSSRIWQFIIWL